MRRALSLITLVAALMASPAFAAGHGGGDAKPDKKTNDPGTKVDMPFLIAPMNKDGVLLGYAYISPKVIGTSSSAVLAVREKLAFVQDAFVRDVNAAPISAPGDPTQVDRALLTRRLTADLQKVLGPGKVAKVYFGDDTAADPGIQFSPLHPTQTPVPAALVDETAPPAETKPAKTADATHH
ncbi:MAG: hypothetical protein JO294_07000 [Alphaproteobacteria bacterium]|nr:hypothetical protein [Alphaproteobacteria bacterium]MBV9903380.1 hypothetical protein [Alphaproteobacteria bacterium]